MNKRKISIIIPTYNEEEYLPKLLESIKSQDFTDYEVIVADAQSNDNTREIAKEYGCIVVEGGLPGPGRNRGAEVAKGEILLFLDSDLKLTEHYLANVIEEFEGENLGIAITQMTPLSEKKRDKYLHDLANWFIDDEPVSVQAHLTNRGHSIMDVDDTGEGFIRYKNGATLSFWAMNNYACDEAIEIRLFCENGKAYMSYDDARIEFNVDIVVFCLWENVTDCNK